MSEDFQNRMLMITDDRKFMDWALGLKSTYADQRSPWEQKWKQARAAVYGTDDLDQIYSGRAKIKSPQMKIKVRGTVARVSRIIFNADPFARLENTKIVEGLGRDAIDLWDKYIFQKQMSDIRFHSAFKIHTKNKVIEGTAISKVPQVFETKSFTYFDDGEKEDIVIKDNPYFQPLLLEEFYSDVNKSDINDSQACIHSTILSIDDIKKNRKRKEKVIYDMIDPMTGEVIGQEEVMEEKGIYENIELLIPDSSNITEEQEEYIQLLGFNATRSREMVREFKKDNKEAIKTGFVKIDEIYGKYPLDGEEQEILGVIANGKVVIRRPQPTPFKHKRYVRPFIRGVYEPIANCLYGDSNVIAGHNLLLELNASREQAADAKTRAIAPMKYIDVTKKIVWDYKYRPDGVIFGVGPKAIEDVVNPYLGNVTINDSLVIQRDLDTLFNQSPVQEGTTDNRFIPSTATGTQLVIAQNDLPLNDLIDDTYENEIKTFIEMVYERNLVFKDVSDLLEIWKDDELKSSGINENTSMKELSVNFNIKVLGNLELSNEIAHQQGYISFLNVAAQFPELRQRIDYKVVGEKLLKSFGIKDDSEGIFYDDDTWANVMENMKKQAAEQQKQQEAQLQQMIQRELQKLSAEEKIKADEEIRVNQAKIEAQTEADIVEKQAEAVTERTLDVKVQ
jgi:hypothetical protein